MRRRLTVTASPIDRSMRAMARSRADVADLMRGQLNGMRGCGESWSSCLDCASVRQRAGLHGKVCMLPRNSRDRTHERADMARIDTSGWRGSQ
jgi:hypothetical protein